MATFRCYFLDNNGHIAAAEYLHVEALGDALDNALSLLREKPEHHSIEIWRGSEKLYPGGTAICPAEPDRISD